MTKFLSRLQVATVEGLATAVSTNAHMLGTRAKFYRESIGEDCGEEPDTAHINARKQFDKHLDEMLQDALAIKSFLNEIWGDRS